MSRFHLAVIAVATSCFASIAPPIGSCARAQDVLLDVKSPVSGAGASFGVAIGDWDGDGTGDLAIGAPNDSTAASFAGALRIHSGKDGSILATFYGTHAGDNFGFPIAPMPDLDGDGIDDFAVSAELADFNGGDTGSVYLYSGRTGALQRRIDGAATSVRFGLPLGSLGDVDGDGIGDLFAGNAGVGDLLHVLSGSDGHEITTIFGPSNESFGLAASALDDLDGDLVRDLLVSAMFHLDGNGRAIGAAYVVSTATGAILRTHEGTRDREYLGQGVTTLADLDGDGASDYAVSSGQDDLTPPRGGMVQVFSGATGAQLAKITTPSAMVEELGSRISAAGDLNGDGVGDLAVSGKWLPSRDGLGAAFLFSGKTFLELDRIDTQAYGVVLAPFGDLNGDGFDDLIVGLVDGSGDGEVLIDSGDDLWLDATPSEPAAGDLLRLNTREGVPGALTILVLEAVDGAPTFQILGGVRTFGSLGGNLQSGTTPPGLAGHDITLRSFANDAAGKLIAGAAQTVTFQ